MINRRKGIDMYVIQTLCDTVSKQNKFIVLNLIIQLTPFKAICIACKVFHVRLLLDTSAIINHLKL